MHKKKNSNKKKKNNIAIIYITHKIDEIFKIANEVTVLRDGKLISNRDINDTSEEILIQDMVGRKVEQKFDRPNKSFDKVLMNIKNISTKSKLKDISFDLEYKISQLQNGDELFLQLTSFSEEGYNYFNSRELNLDGFGGPFGSEPVPIFSNIENGIGVFGSGNSTYFPINP